jgi:hypothetical protein
LAGSPPMANTIGIVLVATFAANFDGRSIAKITDMALVWLSRRRRWAIVVTICPAEFNANILPFDKPGCFQILIKNGGLLAQVVQSITVRSEKTAHVTIMCRGSCPRGVAAHAVALATTVMKSLLFIRSPRRQAKCRHSLGQRRYHIFHWATVQKLHGPDPTICRRPRFLRP